MMKVALVPRSLPLHRSCNVRYDLHLLCNNRNRIHTSVDFQVQHLSNVLCLSFDEMKLKIPLRYEPSTRNPRSISINTEGLSVIIGRKIFSSS
jgi:hypothetical protein